MDHFSDERCGICHIAEFSQPPLDIETKGLTNCMHKHGDKLNHACVAALVQAGEVSQAEVDRRKAAKK